MYFSRRYIGEASSLGKPYLAYITNSKIKANSTLHNANMNKILL